MSMSLLLNTLNNMANVFERQGEYEKALEYYEESLKLKKKSLGDEHVSVADTLNNMANVFDQGEYEKALEYYEESLS